MSIKADIARFQKIIRDLDKEAAKIIEENADRILRLLKEGQLDKGLTSKGTIAGLYSPVTDAIASSPAALAGIGKPRQDKIAGQPYNFDWTGKWRDSMFIKTLIRDQGFDILSRDTKTKMLEQFVGERLTKLTEEHNEIVNEEILLPELFKRSLDQLFD